MSVDELAVMDSNKCVLQLRGVRPFISDKFDITKHEHYKLLSDFDKKNLFEIEKHMQTNLRFKKDEVIDVIRAKGFIKQAE